MLLVWCAVFSIRMELISTEIWQYTFKQANTWNKIVIYIGNLFCVEQIMYVN